MKREPYSDGYGSRRPPDEIYVRVYFLQQGATEVDAQIFIDHYKTKSWQNEKGELIKNWKQLAWTWIFYH